MPDLIEKPTIIAAAGNLPKRIGEYVGRVNSATAAVSIARMEGPAGWTEPGQTPEFDEYSVVLRGLLRVETRSGTMDVKAGQAIAAHRGEWVRYSTPEPGGSIHRGVHPGLLPRLGSSGVLSGHPLCGLQCAIHGNVSEQTVKCDVCSGSGHCTMCKGTSNGGQCTNCAGTGKCPQCRGTGHRKPVHAK